jgi:hypothetical protein
MSIPDAEAGLQNIRYDRDRAAIDVAERGANDLDLRRFCSIRGLMTGKKWLSL